MFSTFIHRIPNSPTTQIQLTGKTKVRKMYAVDSFEGENGEKLRREILLTAY